MNVLNCMTLVSEYGFTKMLKITVELWERSEISREQAVTAIAVIQAEHNFLRPNNAKVFTLDQCAKVYGGAL